jgi:O-antigen/teichoic acid export membrane protein
MTMNKNSVYTLLSLLVPSLIALVTIPFYIKIIGLEQFGYLSLMWIVIGVFGFFDLGLSRAATFRIAITTDQLESQTVVGSVMLMGVVSSLVAAPVVWVCSHLYITFAINVGFLLNQKLHIVIIILSMLVSVNIMSTIIMGILQGVSNFLASSSINIINSISNQVIPLLFAIYISKDLVYIVASILISRIIILIVSVYLVARLVAHCRLWLASWRTAVDMLAFGKWVMASSILGPLILYADRFVVGGVAGPHAIALYSIPFQFAQRMSLISNSIGSAAMPGLSKMNEDNAIESIERIFSTLLIICLIIFTVSALMSNLFFRNWLPLSSTSEVASIFIILVAAFSINCFTAITHFYVSSRAKPSIITRSMIIEFIPYLILLFVMSSTFGIIGAAWSFLILCTVDFVIIIALTQNRPNGLRYAVKLIAGMAIIYAVQKIILGELMIEWR